MSSKKRVRRVEVSDAPHPALTFVLHVGPEGVSVDEQGLAASDAEFAMNFDPGVLSPLLGTKKTWTLAIGYFPPDGYEEELEQAVRKFWDKFVSMAKTANTLQRCRVRCQELRGVAICVDRKRRRGAALTSDLRTCLDNPDVLEIGADIDVDFRKLRIRDIDPTVRVEDDNKFADQLREPAIRVRKIVDEFSLDAENLPAEAEGEREVKSDHPHGLDDIVNDVRQTVAQCTKAQHEAVFDAIRDGLARVREPIAAILQEYLDGLDGLEFGSLRANQDFMVGFRAVLHELALDVACNKAGCRRTGMPKVSKTASPHGSFKVGHQRQPATAHSSSPVLPRYQLAAPDHDGLPPNDH